MPPFMIYMFLFAIPIWIQPSGSVGAVMDLDDGNFEQLTQATTGSSTGDWFVLIYDDTEQSKAMVEIWDDLALLEADEPAPVNVAKMHKSNEISTKRIKAHKKHPQVRYLQRGRSYTISDVVSAKDAKSKVTEEALKEAKGRRIPDMPGTFQIILRKFSSFVLDNVKENPVMFIVGCVLGVIALVAGLVFCAMFIENKTKKE
jgi:hypothetical protein